MNIKTATKLDYIFKVISDELNQNFNFEIIWNNNRFGMLTANLINFENNSPIEEKLVNNYIQKNNLDANFLSLREKFFQKFVLSDPFALKDFNNSIENSSSVIFKSLIDFVENDNSDIPNNNVIYNVKLLNQSKKFEFVLLPKDASLTPISLWAISKN